MFFLPFAKTVIKMSSVVAKKLQLSYTNKLCWSFSPNSNLTSIVPLVIGISLCSTITSLQTWDDQQLKKMFYDSLFKAFWNKSAISEERKIKQTFFHLNANS